MSEQMERLLTLANMGDHPLADEFRSLARRQAETLARQAAEVEQYKRALEWLVSHPGGRPMLIARGWSVWDERTKLHVAPTPLAAINAAIDAEMEKT